jgi:hypothetical protein
VQVHEHPDPAHKQPSEPSQDSVSVLNASKKSRLFHTTVHEDQAVEEAGAYNRFTFPFINRKIEIMH